MATEFSWGYNDKTAEAPYYLIFSCYTYPRTSEERANLSNPITRIILPGEGGPEEIAKMDFAELVADLGKKLSNVSERFQGDAFGQIQSKLGRLDLLTTESGYLGSSKRKYAFNWNLKATSETANTFIARRIGEEREVC